jgi:hypothetical protein
LTDDENYTIGDTLIHEGFTPEEALVESYEYTDLVEKLSLLNEKDYGMLSEYF